MLNLQKSQYGPQYYVNLGFWFTEASGEKFPKASSCHIAARLGSLLPTNASRIGELFDLEYDIADEFRASELWDLLEAHVQPLIEKGSSVAGLRALYDEGVFVRSGLRRPAMEALGLPTRESSAENSAGGPA